MIADVHPVLQAFLGTLLTWGLTAAGAALVFVFKRGQRGVLDGSLGFAAGVMLAASYWSLLAPAIEMAASSKMYGSEGQYAFIPVAVGFLLGGIFVYGSDHLITSLGVASPNIALALESTEIKSKRTDSSSLYIPDNTPSENSSAVNGEIIGNESMFEMDPESSTRKRHGIVEEKVPAFDLDGPFDNDIVEKQRSWRRILLLIVAITVHNIPEGLAVGVGFGSIGKSKLSTLESARNLAIGIGIQNFPEGLAVSLPLRGSGYSAFRSFWYGQLSGMVEPIAGVLGAFAVVVAEPLLPYALAFAAGAMVYVVVDDIIPEAQLAGNGRLATWGTIIGFIVMMSLDVGLG
eukprot:gene8850-9798_t